MNRTLILSTLIFFSGTYCATSLVPVKEAHSRANTITVGYYDGDFSWKKIPPQKTDGQSKPAVDLSGKNFSMSELQNFNSVVSSQKVEENDPAVIEKKPLGAQFDFMKSDLVSEIKKQYPGKTVKAIKMDLKTTMTGTKPDFSGTDSDLAYFVRASCSVTESKGGELVTIANMDEPDIKENGLGRGQYIPTHGADLLCESHTGVYEKQKGEYKSIGGFNSVTYKKEGKKFRWDQQITDDMKKNMIYFNKNLGPMNDVAAKVKDKHTSGIRDFFKRVSEAKK